MTVPTITTITPASGSPTGGQVIQIVGTNFRLPTPPGSTVPVPPPAPSVRVTFGGVVSPRVDVVSATRLFVHVPKYTMPISDQTTLGTASVSLVVSNINDAGAVIAGETATAANGFTFVRPSVTHANTVATITKCVRQFIDLLRSEVHPNVVLETSADYDVKTSTWKIESQSLPQVILTGPTLTNNTFFTYRGPYDVDGAPGESYRKRRHRVVDVQFEIIGVTSSTVENINLIELMETVIDRNTTFSYVHDVGVTYDLELRWVDDPAYERQDNDLISDLRVFRGTVQLVGLPLTNIPGVDQDAIVGVSAEIDEVLVESITQIGDIQPHGAPTRSPGSAPFETQPRAPSNTSTRSPGEQPFTESLDATPSYSTRSPPDVGVPSSDSLAQGRPVRSPPDAGEQE